VGKIADALAIGGGSAGLMAGNRLACAGASVCLAKPSIGRKFPMAGKFGLNLTEDEPLGRFLEAHGSSKKWFSPMFEAFGEEVKDWARHLDQELFAGATGRCFPSR